MKKLLIDLALSLFIVVTIVPLLITVMLYAGYTFLRTWPKDIIATVDNYYYGRSREEDTEV